MTRTYIQIVSSLAVALLAFTSTATAQDGSISQEVVEDGAFEGPVVLPPPAAGTATGVPTNEAQSQVSSPAAAPASIQQQPTAPPIQTPSTDRDWSEPYQPAAHEEERDVSQDRLLHGFRLGYLLVANVDAAWDEESDSTESYRDHYDLRSPHQFIFGYELTWRMIGHDWLNVLLVSNILIAGVEQSRFFPSLNGLLGFEFSNTFQIGVGVSLTPTNERGAHMLAAAGWTPRVGGFYLPVHVFFVPDPHGHHRLGLTTGVNF